MMNEPVICLYPNYSVMYNIIGTDLTKELKCGKVYEAICKEDVFGVYNENYEFVEYDSKYFMKSSEYDELEYTDKDKLFLNILKETFVEKYPKGYDYDNHELVEVNMEEFKSEFFVEYIDMLIVSRMHGKLLEVILDGGSAIAIYRDIEKRYTSKCGFNIKSLRYKVDYSDFLKMKKRDVIKLALFG